MPGLVVGAPAPKPAATPAARPGDLSVGDLVTLLRTGSNIVRSRIWYALLAALLVGGGLGYLVFGMKTEHTAVTTLLAQSALDQILQKEAGQQGGVQEQENQLRNHLSVMKSRRFTVRLANAFSDEERMTIMAPHLLPGAEVTLADFEVLLSGQMGAERERGREFFTLSFTHRNADVAVLVADRMTSTYLKLVQEEFKEANVSGASLLATQAHQLQEEITELENVRRDYRITNGIISVEENQGILTERLRRIDANRADIRLQRVKLEAQLRDAERAMAATPTPFDNPLLASFSNNQILRQELDRLNAQRDVLASKYGRKHPKMRDIDSAIAGVQENITKTFDLALRDLRSQYESARTIEDQLEKEFAEAFSSGIEIEKLANRYLILGSEVAAKRETLASLHQRVSAAGLNSQLPADVMRVVDPAAIDNPRVPKRVLFGVMVALLAGGAFVGLPLVMHVFDEKIKGTMDIEKVLGKELLGAVPLLSKVRVEDRAHIVRDRIEIPLVEAYVSIAANLELMAGSKYPRRIVVTSALPGEGKSTLASNLATSYTRLGKRVVILDLDLRRPTQHRLHAVPDQCGFLHWAKTGYMSDGLLAADGPLGLRELPDGTWLIGAGGEDPQPTNYLVSRHVAELLDTLETRFDVIVIDTPPAGLFQDAAVVSRLVHDRLLVAREGIAPVDQVRNVIATFDKARTPFSGIVLNGFSRRGAHKTVAYSYNYSNYGYHTTTAGKPSPAKEKTKVEA